jgi:hypothetical protein
MKKNTVIVRPKLELANYYNSSKFPILHKHVPSNRVFIVSPKGECTVVIKNFTI